MNMALEMAVFLGGSILLHRQSLSRLTHVTLSARKVEWAKKVSQK